MRRIKIQDRRASKISSNMGLGWISSFLHRCFCIRHLHPCPVGDIDIEMKFSNVEIDKQMQSYEEKGPANTNSEQEVIPSVPEADDITSDVHSETDSVFLEEKTSEKDNHEEEKDFGFDIIDLDDIDVSVDDEIPDDSDVDNKVYREDLKLGRSEMRESETSEMSEVERKPDGNEGDVYSVTSTKHGEEFLRQKSRSRSAGGSPSESPRGSKLQTQTSVHGSRCHRQRSFRRSEDDIKRSRSQSVAYELSQDLQDKQTEMLERKYGGSLRSRRAAKIIQRAFRQYSMNKNFEKLRIAVGERRLSKRLSDIGRSSTVYTDRISLDGHYVMGMPHAHSNGDVKRHSDISGKRSTDVDGLRYTDNRLQQQISLDSCMRREQLNLQARLSNHDRKKLMRHKEAVDELDVPCGLKDGKNDETNNNRNSCPEMNDSSASDSPQPTPLESVVDLHSLDFETLLESKETDILTDSFQSDGLHGDHSQLYSGYGHKKASASSLYSNTSTDTLESNKSQNLTYEQFNQTNYSDSGSFGSQGDIKVKVEGMLQDNIRTPEQKQMADQTLKYYMNQEVKLRARNDSQNNSNKKPPVPNRGPEASPIWKRKNLSVNDAQWAKQDQKRMSNISETSEADSQDGHCSSSPSSDNINASAENVSLYSDQGIGHQRRLRLSVTPEHGHTMPKTADKHRKRTYRIGLNLFNKKPERGIQFLCENGFLEESPPLVARFLITRKGLSKHMIGEYLGNLQNEFNMDVLHFFAQEVDLSGLQVDMALRKFQSYFRMPGEAQKIERLMEAFASRYCTCNPDQIKNFRNIDTVFLLAFAIIMLNTDLHNSSIKQERKMKLEDFIKNLRDIDDGHDVDHDMLVGIYERIKNQEFRAGVDHVTQVMKVEQTVVGKRPQLALPHRRLVCYCRLYEVHDPNKKEKIGLHQREVFLFNDLLLVSKIFSKKKSGITYSYKQSFSLCGMQVFLFETSHYQYGVRLTQGMDNKVLITFNARNEHDRQKFVDDLKEAILESNGMEQIRIEEELQKHSANHNTIDRHYANDDSRVLMYELMKPSDPATNRLSAPECGGLKKLNLSNSLTDLCQGPGMRRGSSGGSLDSGVASGGSGGVSGEVITPQTSQSSLHSRGSPASGNMSAYMGNKGQGKLSAVSLKKGLPAGTEV